MGLKRDDFFTSGKSINYFRNGYEYLFLSSMFRFSFMKEPHDHDG